jgi:hypothetical protein
MPKKTFGGKSRYLQVSKMFVGTEYGNVHMSVSTNRQTVIVKVGQYQKESIQIHDLEGDHGPEFNAAKAKYPKELNEFIGEVNAKT